MKKINWTEGLIILGITIGIIFLWNTPFIYPLKIFVVFIHEISHGFMAILTGGKIASIQFSSNECGVCSYSGGKEWLVAPAGYLGSMFFGASLLFISAKFKTDKFISIVLSLILLFVTILYVRNGFGLIFGIASALAIFGISFLKGINRIFIHILALTSIFYSIIDIKDDLIMNSIPQSDAYAMSNIIPLPPVVWGIIWIVIALYVSYKSIKYSLTVKE